VKLTTYIPLLPTSRIVERYVHCPQISSWQSLCAVCQCCQRGGGYTSRYYLQSEPLPSAKFLNLLPETVNNFKALCHLVLSYDVLFVFRFVFVLLVRFCSNCLLNRVLACVLALSSSQAQKLMDLIIIITFTLRIIIFILYPYKLIYVFITSKLLPNLIIIIIIILLRLLSLSKL
jgi:hypothetical protein